MANQTTKEIPESEHKVYMYRNDYDAMRAEVKKNQHIKTGGNLFGLWTTSGSAVIQVVLGLGRFVNDDNHMLCHVGEWHFHRQSLNKPSAEEEQSVKRNFPPDMSKFLVIIANITSGDAVELSPYFFTHGGAHYQRAECVVLESKNPFATILAKIELGVERNHDGGASLTDTETPRNTASNSRQNDTTRSTYSQAAAGSSRNTGPNTRRDNYTSSTHSQATSPNASYVTSMETSDTGSPVNSPVNHTLAQNQTANTEGEKATPKEIIMKDTYDELEKFFGQGKVEMELASDDYINMIFEHESYHWMIRFPANFPNQPAQLCRAFIRRDLSSCSPFSDYKVVEPLTNHVNILLSIKKTCYGSLCKICKNITKETLTKPATATMPPVNTKLTDVVNELKNEIQMTLSSPLQFTGEAQNDGSYRIEFEHYYKKWSIEIPAEFPDKPAEVYQQRRRGVPRKKTINDFSEIKHEQKLLVSSDLIMLAIRSNCYCPQCFKVH